MPTVTLNKKVLEELMGKKLPIEQLKDRISMLGTDLDSIEGDEITVEVFPNRPDMLSEQGFARALSSFIGVKKGLRDFKVRKAEKDFKVIVDKSVHKIRPYTACTIIKNLKLTDEKIREIIQIQEKLHVSLGRNRKKLAIGIYPLEQISLPIRYTAKKPEHIHFQPLESNRKMTGLEILSKHSAGRDYAHLLEGFDLFPIFIDANDEILSMPPIINSEKTGKITPNTKEVFIEVSGFDLDALNQCLNIIVTSLIEMGGDAYEMEVKYSTKKIVTPDLKPKKWKLDINYINKMIGIKFNEKQIKDLLEKMGYGYDKGNILVPAYRTDILHQIDFAEDIAIAYGYENFEPEIPNVSTIGEEDKLEKLKRRVANILVGIGFIETNSYHLTNKNEQNNKMRTKLELVELENASSNEYNVLRNWITPSLMNILSKNTNQEYPQPIFEIGNIFKLNPKTETGVKENWRIGVAIASPESDFTKIKQVFDALMNALNLKYKLNETKHDSFINGRVGRISINKKDVAYIGELHPEVITNFGVEMPVCAFELNLSEIIDEV